MVTTATGKRLKPASESKKQAAMQYLEGGHSVLPFRDKATCYIKRRTYQSRKPSKAEVTRWWRKWPEAMVGVLCGRVSGGLVVVDIDDIRTAAQLGKSELMNITTMVETPRGGLHIYFREPRRRRLKSQGLGGNVGDIKAEGGHVIVPPSPGYRFLSQKEPICVSDPWAEVLEFLEE